MAQVTTTDPIIALLPKAKRRWGRTAPQMARLAKLYPPEPHDMTERDAFTALAVSIIHQQVSIQAGRTIWERTRKAVGRFTPNNVIKAGETRLVEAGVSRQKRGYLMDLALKFANKEIQPGRFDTMEDEAIITELTQVKGIGTWTSKMFLMFHLARPDVVAPEDLGLRLAVARFYDVPADQAAMFMRNEAPAWSPYNTLAARILWNARRIDDEGGGGI